jgi:glycerate kinase
VKIVVAPDSFKGSLTALEAARAMERGARRVADAIDVHLCPLSDGGEGFLDVLSAALNASLRDAPVTGPQGTPVTARWGITTDGTAVVESAEAIGLGRLRGPPTPLDTTTHGVGELVLLAVRAGARRIVVGVGGSATTDGGAGMARALGVVFEGAPRLVTARDLRAIAGIGALASFPGVELLAAVDVDNPLTGPDGAARVYAPQKGATPEDVQSLEAALVHFASLVGDPGEHPGDGAAGGLGYGFRVFAGARRVNGVDFVLDSVELDRKLAGADLILTGEGRLDSQSARGKVVSGVCRRARNRHVPVIALVGSIGSGADRLLTEDGLAAYYSLLQDARDESDANARAAPLLEALTERVVREWHSRRTG